MGNLFAEELIDTAITRIRKFATIANTYGFEIALGFSGGKDSEVVYDLCRRAGVPFKAYYNVSFESATTKRFIRENYPDVIWRREHRYGFIENIWRNHCGMLPTVERAFCCEDYKHNPKYVDKCSIVGVRRQESLARSARTAFSYKNKTAKKNMQSNVTPYFTEHCQSIGTASVIQLSPIVDWSEEDVWDYIHRYNLPINPEYQTANRVGCIVCPKAHFSRNYQALIRYPKLIDAFIKAKEKKPGGDWIITLDNKDYCEDKVYYICRWLNRSFKPFTKRQEREYSLVRDAYLRMHHQK